MSTPAIHIKNMGFTYSENSGVVFKNFNLQVAAGERFGLFGPNGAGKTTLMNLMTGVLSVNAGHIELFGTDIDSSYKKVNPLFGFVPQFHSFYPELSAEENLHFFGAWSGLTKPAIKERTEELLQVMGLANVRKMPVGKFSGGMKSRINLAIGVLHKPRILFLDEPTTGVDVQTRHAIQQYLLQLNKQGTTLFYTSHQLREAEEICNEVALIDAGGIIAQDNLPALLRQHRQDGLEGLFLSLTGKAYRDS